MGEKGISASSRSSRARTTLSSAPCRIKATAVATDDSHAVRLGNDSARTLVWLASIESGDLDPIASALQEIVDLLFDLDSVTIAVRP